MIVCNPLIVLVLATACILSSHVSSVRDPEKGGGHLPTKLTVQSSSFRGNSISIVWNGKLLDFEKMVEGRTTHKEKITPSKESWNKFWMEMDAVGIWAWKAEYIDKTIADGHSWDVLIEYGNKKIHARGSNMFPAQFERYENAVRELYSDKAK